MEDYDLEAERLYEMVQQDWYQEAVRLIEQALSLFERAGRTPAQLVLRNGRLEVGPQPQVAE